jgi:hypothetical protein
MNDKTRRVFNGWLSLSDSERVEFDAAVREFRTAAESTKRELRESIRSKVEKMDTGPVGSPCACCGR